MSNATEASNAVKVQEDADAIVAMWLTQVERFNVVTIDDAELDDRLVKVAEVIRLCRTFAEAMSPEYRPVKKLGDVIGHDSLKRSLGRLFKIGKATSLGEIKKGYRNYLKAEGKL